MSGSLESCRIRAGGGSVLPIWALSWGKLPCSVGWRSGCPSRAVARAWRMLEEPTLSLCPCSALPGWTTAPAPQRSARTYRSVIARPVTCEGLCATSVCFTIRRPLSSTTHRRVSPCAVPATHQGTRRSAYRVNVVLPSMSLYIIITFLFTVN